MQGLRNPLCDTVRNTHHEQSRVADGRVQGEQPEVDCRGRRFYGTTQAKGNARAQEDPNALLVAVAPV